jgi:hypothetical protein
MSDKDALFDSVTSGYEFRLQELDAKLAESQKREEKLLGVLESANAAARRRGEENARLREYLKEAIEALRQNKCFGIATLFELALTAKCVCGHPKEQHEGHTQVPDAPTPTHCSAGCGCRAYQALAAKEAA